MCRLRSCLLAAIAAIASPFAAGQALPPVNVTCEVLGNCTGIPDLIVSDTGSNDVFISRGLPDRILEANEVIAKDRQRILSDFNLLVDLMTRAAHSSGCPLSRPRCVDIARNQLLFDLGMANAHLANLLKNISASPEFIAALKAFTEASTKLFDDRLLLSADRLARNEAQIAIDAATVADDEGKVEATTRALEDLVAAIEL